MNNPPANARREKEKKNSFTNIARKCAIEMPKPGACGRQIALPKGEGMNGGAYVYR
jgi:hypothetical protein